MAGIGGPPVSVHICRGHTIPTMAEERQCLLMLWAQVTTIVQVVVQDPVCDIKNHQATSNTDCYDTLFVLIFIATTAGLQTLT